MATNILYKKLSNAREEKDVDNAYAEAFMKAYKIDVIEHPFKCDGYIEDIFKKLIIEYKYDEDFSLPTAKSKVLLQVLFYLKQFELGGGERFHRRFLLAIRMSVFLFIQIPLSIILIRI